MFYYIVDTLGTRKHIVYTWSTCFQLQTRNHLRRQGKIDRQTKLRETVRQIQPGFAHAVYKRRKSTLLKIEMYFVLNYFFSVRHLSFLHSHSFFSSLPQRPMTSDFKGFLSQILPITFFNYLYSSERASISLFNIEC